MTELIVFVIILLVVVIAFLIYTNKEVSNSEGQSKEGFIPGVFGASPGTKPDVEKSKATQPGNVVKVDYFYKPSCPFCKNYTPIFREAVKNLESDFPNLRVLEHDITQAGNGELLVQATGKQSNTVPTVMLTYDDGRKLFLNSAQRNHLELYVRHTE